MSFYWDLLIILGVTTEYSCLRFKHSGFGSFLVFLLVGDHMLHFPLLESYPLGA